MSTRPEGRTGLHRRRFVRRPCGIVLSNLEVVSGPLNAPLSAGFLDLLGVGFCIAGYPYERRGGLGAFDGYIKTGDGCPFCGDLFGGGFVIRLFGGDVLCRGVLCFGKCFFELGDPGVFLCQIGGEFCFGVLCIGRGVKGSYCSFGGTEAGI